MKYWLLTDRDVQTLADIAREDEKSGAMSLSAQTLSALAEFFKTGANSEAIAEICEPLPLALRVALPAMFRGIAEGVVAHEAKCARLAANGRKGGKAKADKANGSNCQTDKANGSNCTLQNRTEQN